MSTIRESLKLWGRAFWIVLRGRPSEIGQRRHLVLFMAVTWSLGTPFITYFLAAPYQGVVPSETQFMKAYGVVKFETIKVGLKDVGVATFVTKDERAYQLEDLPARIPQLKELKNEQGITPEIYVEGFRLLDGDGRFWIAYAATRDGRVLLGRELQSEKLQALGTPFGKVLLWLYITVSPCWLISFFTVRKVRTSLGA